MTNEPWPDTLNEPAFYRITVGCQLDPDWSDCFGGLEIGSEQMPDGSSVTHLTGVIVDQVALRGILGKIWDLNLSVISVIRYQDREAAYQTN